MLFDVQAALSEILQGNAATPATTATTATNPPEIAPMSQMSRVSQAGRAEIITAVPAGNPQTEPPLAPSASVLPLHRGMVATWCGVWVSRAQWDAMSDLERHGPQGRLFCGKCWQYRERETALSCLDESRCP